MIARAPGTSSEANIPCTQRMSISSVMFGARPQNNEEFLKSVEAYKINSFSSKYITQEAAEAINADRDSR